MLEFLNSHASVRSFTDRIITNEEEQTIITTAQRSPTSSNRQAYSIIGIRNPESKLTIASLAGDQDHIKTSSLFLVFCADLARLKKLSTDRGYDFSGHNAESFIVATVDCTLAAGRALMAAQALGLGGVMVGAIRNNPDKIVELLNLPQLVYPVMGMSLGEPKIMPKIKPRLGVDAIYHQEKYEDSQYDQAIDAYDKVIDELGYLKGREVQPDRYPAFKSLYSWSEHTARRQAHDDPQVRRDHIFGFLKNQGFLQS